MTSKERMMTALAGGKPDRLPITIHQWQAYQLEHHMGGLDQVEAFKAAGLDASTCVYDVMFLRESPNWRQTQEDLGVKGDERYTRYHVVTPDGDLTWVTATNPYTTFKTEFPVKNEKDAEAFIRHFPGLDVNVEALNRWYDQTGDSGIVRGFPSFFGQSGPWQDFCEMVGTEEAIFWAMDEPELVHHVLDGLTQGKVENVYRVMPGLHYDLVECGGGSASANVISPSMFEEFCVPYDKRLNDAIRETGHKTVYHTCGHMMQILDLIPLNGTDAAETLSPPGVGGNIRPEDRPTVKAKLGSKVPLIGGVDQKGLETWTPEQVEAEVVNCFETFGVGGGYICSASDHFFQAPLENLKAMSRAAERCVY